MFRLLTILLALHFWIEADGAPTFVTGPANNGAARKKMYHPELVSDTEKGKAKEAAIPVLGAEKDIENHGPESTFKQRKQNDSIAKKLHLKGKLTKKGKKAKATLDSKLSSSLDRTGSIETSFSDSENSLGYRASVRKDTASELATTEEYEDSDSTTVSPSSSPSLRWQTPSDERPSSPQKSRITAQDLNKFKALRATKDAAVKIVNAAEEALTEKNVNPYDDENLAQLISLAIERYNEAYNRPELNLEGLDEDQIMDHKLEEFGQISDDLDRRAQLVAYKVSCRGGDCS